VRVSTTDSATRRRRLTAAELDERLEAALPARTNIELAALTDSAGTSARP
jgi:hypothetical protein